MIDLLIPFALGLLAGWLINYLVDVLPDTLRLGQPVCLNPGCKAALAWKDYLLLKGCPTCGRKRNLRTFVIITVAVASAVFLRLVPHVPFWLGYPVMIYLIVVATIDIEHRLVLRPLSIAGLLLCAAAGIISHGWLYTLIGGVTGFIIMWLLYMFGRLFSRRRAKRLGLDESDGEEALGSGDVTMATILGLLLGWPLVWSGLLLGILLAGAFSLLLVIILLVSKKYKENTLNVFIPYVPFFIIAAILLFYLPGWMGSII
jgi:hypothetical protein